MNYFESEQQLEGTLEQLLLNSGLPAYGFIDEIYAIVNPKKIILKEIGIIFQQIEKIIQGDKHRDQFFEILEENFDWERETTKTIASEIDDRVLSPLQKYIRAQNEGVSEQKIDILKKRTEEIDKITKQNRFETPQPDTLIHQPQINRSLQPTEDQKNEIQRLKEKIQQLEERGGEYAPQQYEPSQPTIQKVEIAPNIRREKKESVKQKSFGIAPARDLGTEDFDWKGDIGGVEIEKQYEEDGNKENLDKAQILEGVEYPPNYLPTSSTFEEKLQKPEGENTDFAESVVPPKQIPKITREENTTRATLENLETERLKTYRDGDPYREPIE